MRRRRLLARFFAYMRMYVSAWGSLLFVGGLLLAGCDQPPAPAAAPVTHQPVTVHSRSLRASAQPCVDRFDAHDLDHVTTTADGTVRMFEANGAGVAIGDLDNDGDLDFVLGNYAGANTIFWNEGGLRFHKQTMAIGKTRAVTLVDVDADGWQDMVVTRVSGAINYWRNQGRGIERGERFQQEFLPGFAYPAYVLDWADLDADGDLDAVTASYDAGLLTTRGNAFLQDGGGGVYYYENRGGTFMATALASEAQALAIALLDVDGDGRLDITVGNDFAVPDQIWLRRAGGWVADHPFSTTSHSTMSFDLGDVENDGQLELFSTDMKPYSRDPKVLAAWAPVMRDMWHPQADDDPQTMENVLQDRSQGGRFRNRAYERRIDATGWSWSGEFGDLDSDGFLDLYVVNGFIEHDIFSYLPDHELVEENQVLRNDGSGHFTPRPDWALNGTHSGRGMAMADLDGDGDLDVVVNNLRGPAQLFENRLCGGDDLLVDLRWPGSDNLRAIGATVYLETSMGRLRRDVLVTRGYLSAAPAQLHFGFPPDATLHRLVVHWPDKMVSVWAQPAHNALLTIQRK